LVIASIIGAITMFKIYRLPSWILFILIIGGLLLASCGESNVEQDNTPLPTSTYPPTTDTPIPPTATSEPLAAIVNGENISMAKYQEELSRYQAAIGTELATEDKQQVLDDLINQTLFAQAAIESGFNVDEAMVQQRFDQLINDLGSRKALDDWLQANGYDENSFRKDLRRAIAVAWMRDQIVNQVPGEMEQVHARQILLYNADSANQALEQLRNGVDFTKLAAEYDPITYGDLGWFPRGYLLDEKLEEVVFKLQPGQYSDVIQTSAGFHIVQVVERESQRPLDDAIHLDLQEKALEDWLAERRLDSQIQIITP